MFELGYDFVYEKALLWQVYKQIRSVNNRNTVKTVMSLTWYRHFQRNGGLNQILRHQTSHFHYGSKVPAVTITEFTTILKQNMQNSSQRSTKFSEEGHSGTSIVNHLHQQPRVTWSILTTKVNAIWRPFFSCGLKFSHLWSFNYFRFFSNGFVYFRG